MHIYISGRVSGTSDFYKRFAEAEEKLLRQGYSPVNPVKNAPLNKSWEYYMRQDIIKLMCCDSIYMMIGWKKSKGARIEHDLAKKLGLRIIYENKRTR